MWVRTHVCLYMRRTCPVLQALSALPDFSEMRFDSRMIYPWSIQPALEDAEGPHAHALADGCWRW